MIETTVIKRFSLSERLFHFLLMLSFLIQSATGFGRLFINSKWGEKVCYVFGGYENASLIHHFVGGIMIAGFLLHIIFLLFKINWLDLRQSLFGPDSLIPNFQDIRHLSRQIRWLFGVGDHPRFDRWTYWEKFDYWGVFWGLPLLAITGIMLIYPLWTCRFAPGWILNVAALLHRAEAILAVSYIFIVHFFIGHLRPASFPMNEAMFSGNVVLGQATEEKPAWIERLKMKGAIEKIKAQPPSQWFRVIYYVFGYSSILLGVYLLINGIIYSRYIRLH